MTTLHDILSDLIEEAYTMNQEPENKQEHDDEAANLLDEYLEIIIRRLIG